METKFVTAMSLLGQTLGLFAGVSLLSAIEALLVFPRAASLYTESFCHVFTFIYIKCYNATTGEIASGRFVGC